MNESAWKLLRELLHGRDLKRASKVEDAAIGKAAEGTVHPALVKELAAMANDPSHAVRLGGFVEGARADDDLLVDVRDLLAHMAFFGASGAGKTFAMLMAILAVLEQRAARSLVVLDMKGDLANLLTERALPMLAARLPPAEADDLLNRIVVVDPFSSTHPPPLNVLVRDPLIPIAIQARDVAECFETATETDVTARMETILDWVMRLVIETGGSFLTVRRALQEPLVLEGLVRQAKDRDVVRYFLTRFPSEPKASKLAILARLDRFLALPMTQLTLGAKYSLDFDGLLKNKITIISLGSAPAGLQSVARFFAMVILTRFVRAIFRLPPQAQGFASVLAADEWQVALNPALAREFESILTLARSRGVHLWLANQQLVQLDRQGTSLRSVVLGQTALQVVFRMAADDTKMLRYLFPVTGTRRRHAGAGSGTSPFLSPSEEVDARMTEASRLPGRVAYWFDRRKPWGAILMRSATLDLPSSSSLSPRYVARSRRGIITFTTSDLEQMRDDEDARLDALAAGPAPQTQNAPALLAPQAPPTLLGAPAPKAPGPKPRVRKPKPGTP